MSTRALDCNDRTWSRSLNTCVGCGLTEEEVSRAGWVVGPDNHPIRRGTMGDMTIEAGGIEFA